MSSNISEETQSHIDSINSNQQICKQNQDVCSRFIKIIQESTILIHNECYSQALSILTLLHQKLNFLHQSKKSQNPILQLVCLYNIAVVYHKQWILDKCIPMVEKVLTIIEEITNDDTQKEYWMGVQKLGIKTRLQFCAILSQVGNHHKALAVVIEVSQRLKSFFSKAYKDLTQMNQRLKSADNLSNLYNMLEQSTSLLSISKPQHADKVQFASSVLSCSMQPLCQLSLMQTYTYTTGQNYPQICKKLHQLKSKTYFWKNNPQNNIKLLRKELGYYLDYFLDKQVRSFVVQKGRNLLGVMQKNSWVQQFTIAKVMVMKPLSYFDVTQKDNLLFEFNYQNLIEKIIWVSVNYFSLAIQIRFTQQQDKQEKQNQIYSSKKQIKQNDKQQACLMKKSQVFHLKSIIILCKLIKQNSSFLNHLVQNYHKHYKQDLITIQQQCSIEQYSIIYEIKSKNKFLSNKQQPLLILKNEDQPVDNKQSQIKFPKSSVYFQQDKKSTTPLSKKPQFLGYKKNALILMKKASYKQLDNSSQSKKLLNSNSLSRNEKSLSSRNSKYINHKELKDRTLKKFSSSKVITLVGQERFFKSQQRLDTHLSDVPNQKYLIDKEKQQRSSNLTNEKSSFSPRNVPSFSIGKSMNSTTLKKTYKNRNDKQRSPSPSFKLKDLKQSHQFKRQFKKKAPQNQVKGQKIDKKKQKLNNGLLLLKKSTSNPNIKKNTELKQKRKDIDLISIKQNSKSRR